jgi:hypothetical protein
LAPTKFRRIVLSEFHRRDQSREVGFIARKSSTDQMRVYDLRFFGAVLLDRRNESLTYQDRIQFRGRQFSNQPELGP